jgi:tetratricopeptide (TPR) repeat protein
MAAKLGRRFWFGLYGFTAVILTLAVVVFAWLASQSRKEAGEGRTASAPAPPSGHVSEERYRLVSQFVPPAYVPRPDAVGAPREFTDAMKLYSEAAYSAAIPLLRAAVAQSPGFASAHYYLGICLLAAEERESGIAQLRAAIALGDTPDINGARFYLAKGLLQSGDLPGARDELQKIISTDNDYRQLAMVMLSQIAPAR